MTNINSNYRLLAAQANQETEKITSGTNGKSLSDMAAEIKSSYQESEDDVTREIEDAADDVSDWTKAEQILTASFDGLAKIATAVKDLAGASGTSSAGAAADSPSKSLDDAISAFGRNQSAENRAALVAQVDAANQTVATIDKDIEDLNTQNQELAAGDYTGVLNDIKGQLDTNVANRTAFQTSLDNIKDSVLPGLKDALQGNEAAQGELEVATDGTLTYKQGQETYSVTFKEQKGEEQRTAASLAQELKERSANKSNLEQDFTNKTNTYNDLDSKRKETQTEDDGNGGTRTVPAHPEITDETVAAAKTDMDNAKKAKEENEKRIENLLGRINISNDKIQGLEKSIAECDGNIDAAVKKLEGYVDEQHILETKNAEIQQRKTEGDTAATAYANFADYVVKNIATLCDLEINTAEAHETAQKQIKENEATIKAKQSEKAVWEKSINKANSALASHPAEEGGVEFKKGQKVTIDGKEYTVKDNSGKKGVTVTDAEGKEHSVTFDANGNPKVEDKPESATTYQPSGTQSEDGKTYKIGGATYDVKDGEYGYYVDKDGKQVEIKADTDTSNLKFKKVGDIPATTQSA